MNGSAVTDLMQREVPGRDQGFQGGSQGPNFTVNLQSEFSAGIPFFVFVIRVQNINFTVFPCAKASFLTLCIN